jgi:hypothetical protein
LNKADQPAPQATDDEIRTCIELFAPVVRSSEPDTIDPTLSELVLHVRAMCAGKSSQTHGQVLQHLEQVATPTLADLNQGRDWFLSRKAALDEGSHALVDGWPLLRNCAGLREAYELKCRYGAGSGYCLKFQVAFRAHCDKKDPTALLDQAKTKLARSQGPLPQQWRRLRTLVALTRRARACLRPPVATLEVQTRLDGRLAVLLGEPRDRAAPPVHCMCDIDDLSCGFAALLSGHGCNEEPSRAAP